MDGTTVRMRSGRSLEAKRPLAPLTLNIGVKDFAESRYRQSCMPPAESAAAGLPHP